MRLKLACLATASILAASPVLAQDAGSGAPAPAEKPHASALKGAVAGGVAGHMMGGHTKTGMVAGAMVGHHMRKKELKQQDGG